MVYRLWAPHKYTVILREHESLAATRTAEAHVTFRATRTKLPLALASTLCQAFEGVGTAALPSWSGWSHRGFKTEAHKVPGVARAKFALSQPGALGEAEEIVRAAAATRE